MQELKATEVKEKNSLEVKLLATQVAYLLPLANSFDFNPSFSILSDVIFDNTSISFLQNVLSSFLVFIQFFYILPIELCKIINYLLYCTKVSS